MTLLGFLRGMLGFLGRMLGYGKLKLLLLKLLNPIGLRLSLLASLPPEVHEEHPEALRDSLRANPIDQAHITIK